jgi:hypothetical protein
MNVKNSCVDTDIDFSYIDSGSAPRPPNENLWMRACTVYCSLGTENAFFVLHFWVNTKVGNTNLHVLDTDKKRFNLLTLKI